MPFRIYYGDGATYDGDPFLAPTVNVQAIQVTADTPRGWGLIHSTPYYCWFGDGSAWAGGGAASSLSGEEFGWQGCDEAGKWDYAFHYLGPQKILFGRTLHDAVYRAIMRRATTEPLL